MRITMLYYTEAMMRALASLLLMRQHCRLLPVKINPQIKQTILYLPGNAYSSMFGSYHSANDGKSRPARVTEFWRPVIALVKIKRQ